MSVAVFSADAITARMLLLEAKRCGFFEKTPEEARIFFVDLDHRVPVASRLGATICIGFCAAPQKLNATEREGFATILSLPLCAKELSCVLKQYGHATSPIAHREGSTQNKQLRFSKLEQSLLTLLYENRDRTVTIQEISSLIGESAENSNAVAVYLYRLRRKLEADGQKRIRTVRGVGYRWLGD